MKDKEFIKELTAGYSTQNKAANQFGLTMMISSTITLTANPLPENLIELPFTLGKVKSLDFYTISLILTCMTSIAFNSAMIQTIRTRMLLQRAIETIKSDLYTNGVHVQDFVDSITSPTYFRVAPLAQFLLGKNQFFGTHKQNRKIKILSTVVYLFIKITAYIFMYIVPVPAILKAWNYVLNASEKTVIPFSRIISIILVAITLITIGITLIGELKFLARVIKRINR